MCELFNQVSGKINLKSDLEDGMCNFFWDGGNFFYVVPLNYMSCHLILDRLLSSIRYVFIYNCNIFQY